MFFLPAGINKSNFNNFNHSSLLSLYTIAYLLFLILAPYYLQFSSCQFPSYPSRRGWIIIPAYATRCSNHQYNQKSFGFELFRLAALLLKPSGTTIALKVNPLYVRITFRARSSFILDMHVHYFYMPIN